VSVQTNGVLLQLDTGLFIPQLHTGDCVSIESRDAKAHFRSEKMVHMYRMTDDDGARYLALQFAV